MNVAYVHPGGEVVGGGWDGETNGDAEKRGADGGGGAREAGGLREQRCGGAERWAVRPITQLGQAHLGEPWPVVIIIEVCTDYGG